MSVQEHLIDPPAGVFHLLDLGESKVFSERDFFPRANGNRMEFQRHCCKDKDVNRAALSVERAFIGACSHTCFVFDEIASWES